VTIQLNNPSSSLTNELCSCGSRVADHRCPTAPVARAVKSDRCRACGQKIHQNIARATVELECLLNQYAESVGALKVRHGKYELIKVPPINPATLRGMMVFLERQITSGTRVPPDTTATIRRAMRRGRAATTPTPTTTPVPTPVPTPVHPSPTTPPTVPVPTPTVVPPPPDRPRDEIDELVDMI
jgi:hypothetical protein